MPATTNESDFTKPGFIKPCFLELSPLQYRPTDPHLGRWAWSAEPDEPGQWRLSEGPDRLVATIHQRNGRSWHAGLATMSFPWLRDAPDDVAAQASHMMDQEADNPQEATERAERVAAALAIACGVAPAPENTTIMFVLGKRRYAALYLQRLELVARQHLPDVYARGALATLPDDPPGQTPNPVAQARALDELLRMPKGHWKNQAPNDADLFDQCMSLDLQHAVEYLERAARLSRPPQA